MVVAMQMVAYQVCRSTEGWVPVRVASSSGEGYYTVLVSPWAVQESICEDKCGSYHFRGRCRHQDEAARRVCRWSERSGRQQQTDEDRKQRICPQCGGPTKYEVEVVDEDRASTDA